MAYNSEDKKASNTNTTGNWKPDEVPQLTVDVYKKNNKIFVVSTVAGVKPTNLDVSINDNTLSIKGVREKPYGEKENELLLQECFWGEFSREITINETLNVDEINANLKNGVLVIEIPIYKITAQRKIEVKE